MGLRRLSPRNCVTCGVEFQPRKARYLNCSQACGWTHAGGKPTHGMSKTPEYKIWCGIKKRCLSPAEPAYARYGARGITICQAWQDSFEAFFADMGPRPSPKHTIDRRDNDGHYEPNNCRWATRSEQARNTSASVFLTIAGERVNITDVAGRYGVDPKMVQQRVRLGLADTWSLERLLTPPPPSGQCHRGHIKRRKRDGSWWCPTCDTERKHRQAAYYAAEDHRGS
jgi:hypothetical protein